MRRFLRKILSQWYVYLFILAASVGVSFYGTALINQPRNEEILRIFVGAASSDTQVLRDLLNGAKPDYLRRIEYYTSVYYTSEFSTMFNAYARGDADMIILPESQCYDNVITYYYQVLDTDYVSSYLASPEYYLAEQTGKPYGIRIHSRDTEETNPVLVYDADGHEKEDYYLFYKIKSCHTGDLSGSSYDTALAFTRLITEYQQ